MFHGCWERHILTYRFCKGPSNDYIGAAKGVEFQETRLEAGFSTSAFVKQEWTGLPLNDWLFFHARAS